MPFGYGWLEVAQIISAFSAPILTLLLAWLYFKMVRIQGRQTDILSSQEDLMEANHRPVLDVSEVSHSGGDNVRMKVANKGNGIAKDLKFGAEVYSESQGMEEISSSLPLGEQEIKFGNQPLIEIKDEGELGEKVEIIEPDSEQSFITSVRISLHDRYKNELITLPPDEKYSINEYIEKLEKEDIDSISHYFYLYYQDITGQNQQKLVESGGIQPESGMGLEDIFAASGLIYGAQIPPRAFMSRYQRAKTWLYRIIDKFKTWVQAIIS